MGLFAGYVLYSHVAASCPASNAQIVKLLHPCLLVRQWVITHLRVINDTDYIWNERTSFEELQ